MSLLIVIISFCLNDFHLNNVYYECNKEICPNPFYCDKDDINYLNQNQCVELPKHINQSITSVQFFNKGDFVGKKQSLLLKILTNFNFLPIILAFLFNHIYYKKKNGILHNKSK